MAQRFLFHVPESEWNRLVPEEARALVRRWQGESRGSADSLGPLRCLGSCLRGSRPRCRMLPLWLVKERTDVSDRNHVASELVSFVTADVRRSWHACFSRSRQRLFAARTAPSRTGRNAGDAGGAP